VTSSKTAGEPGTSNRINLRDPSQLIAAVPHLVGFRPAESVVLIGHRPPDGREVGLVVRGDLPAPHLRVAQAEYLVTSLASSGAVGATVLVVGGGSRPEHAEFVKTVCELLAETGISPLHAMWVPEISSGARWECYVDLECGGVLPATDSTVAAATMASKGAVTFASREDMLAMLKPVDEAVIARRAALLAESAGADLSDADLRRAHRAVRLALAEMGKSDPALTDGQIVELARVITNVRVRDACLVTAIPPGTEVARRAEDLWLTLVRELPAPHRATAATLLGHAAYVRGGGAFAGMALVNALEADPKYVLARLLLAALDGGIEPRRLMGLGRVDQVDDLRVLEARPASEVSPGRRAGAG
jgi:hypothetical protein